MPIVGVPLTENGWDVTWLWDDAGYMHSTAFPTWPGNTGITGHATLSTGLPGPFANLGELKWGDEVIIHAWGLRYRYEIRVVKQVFPGGMSVLSHKEYDWVTMITCKNYNDYLNTYESRLVAQAVLIKVELDSDTWENSLNWIPRTEAIIASDFIHQIPLLSYFVGRNFQKTLAIVVTMNFNRYKFSP
jgi:LPXTG-site transpeptidase (sortase) family protein